MPSLENETDWTERAANLAIATVQVVSILILLEHFHFRVQDVFKSQVSRYRRWLRVQEFELYYSTVWPLFRKHDNDESE